MDKDNILRAKKIFLKYGGSHFHMEREGELETYRKFSISNAQEDLWINEYQNDLLLKVENEDIVSYSFLQLIDVLQRSKNIICIKSLLSIVKKNGNQMDTFSQVLMSEGILSIAESLKGNIETENIKIIEEAKKTALNLLNNSIKKPIIVGSYFSNIDYLKDVITEDKIKNRIKSNIKKCK